jgi:hypothetical protein
MTHTYRYSTMTAVDVVRDIDARARARRAKLGAKKEKSDVEG